MSLFEKINDKLDFLALVSLRTTLKPRGHNKYVGLSVFTQEKTPSLTIDVDKKVYSCFSSGKSGGFISYVQESENLSKEEAIKFLADFCDITMDEKETSEEKLRKILRLSSEYFQRKSGEAEKYFIKRNLDPELVRKFSVGYSDGTLLSYLRTLGYTLEEAEAAGVAYNHEGKYVDYFYKRVVFPIFDFADRVVSFTGRAVEDKDGVPKYLHGRNNTIFSGKSNVLYGLKQCRRDLTDKICIAEGVLDAIAIQSAGIPAVAMLGASASKKQIEYLSKLSQDLYFILDSDRAGKQGLLKSMEHIYELGLDVVSHTTVFTEAKDAAAFLPIYGKKALKEKIENSVSDMVSLVRILAEEYKEAGKKDSFVAHKVIKDLRGKFEYKPDYRSLELIDALASEFNYTKAHIQKVLIEANKDNHFNNAPRAYAMLAPGEVKMKVYERRFLCLMLEHPHLWKLSVESGMMSSDFDNAIIAKTLDSVEKNQSHPFLGLEKDLTSEELTFVTTLFNSTDVSLSSFESLSNTILLKSAQRSNVASAINERNSLEKVSKRYFYTVKDYSKTIRDKLRSDNTDG